MQSFSLESTTAWYVNYKSNSLFLLMAFSIWIFLLFINFL